MAQRVFLTIVVADQMFGIPIMDVHDVLRAQSTTRVPLASPEIVGTLNLRGRIVTALDLRVRLGLPARDDRSASMQVVVHHNSEPYGLLVDAIGEVVSLDDDHREPVPRNLEPHWASLVQGVHRMDKHLLLELDVARVIAGVRNSERTA